MEVTVLKSQAEECSFLVEVMDGKVKVFCGGVVKAELIEGHSAFLRTRLSYTGTKPVLTQSLEAF